MMKVGLSNLKDKLRGFHSIINYASNCRVCGDEEQGIGCHVHDRIYKYITLMQKACIYLKEEYERWHRLECLIGDCSQCGFYFFKVCPQELLDSHSFLLMWNYFEYYQVGVHAETVQPKKRFREAFKETFINKFNFY